MTIADWCVGSYQPPRAKADRRLAGEPVVTGVCLWCERRVRLTTQGHLRRHRKCVAAAVVAQRPPEAPPRARRAPRRKR